MANPRASATTAPKPHVGRRKANTFEPGSKPAAKDDLKSLPVAEVEKNWGRRLTVSAKPRGAGE
jgi:hypothetical protein